MDDSTLTTYIQSKIKDGLGGMDGEVSYQRQDNLDRYYGELYGYEVDGESSVVTRDVMETVEWAMPTIMRAFSTGRHVVSFKPCGPQDEQAAEQETKAVWDAYDEAGGFYITHTIIKSALLNPNSYVKCYFDESEEVLHEEYEGLSEQELAILLDSDEIEVKGQEVEIDEMGNAVYSVEVEYRRPNGELLIFPTPEEEVVVDRNHNELSLKSCHFTCHIRERTMSDLVEDGYDADRLEQIGSDDSEGYYNDERINRRKYSDETGGEDDEADKSMRTFFVNECNMFVDYDGDGIAERRRIVMIGNEIFENEEVTSSDMIAFSSILMPHKHINLCLADLVKDLQEIRTTIMRQLLNNMYKVNNPRTVITDDVNMDDILSNESNGFIRTGDINGIRTEPTTPIIGQVIPALEVLNNEKESRTGISKNAKGLDADVLKSSTMGAYRDAIAQANERVELIIRVLAETGFKELFCKIHELLQRHGEVKHMKVDGQWIAVNPREWRERKQMTAHVGLGHNNQQEKLGAAMAITQHQAALKATGSPIVSPFNDYAGAELIAEAAGETVDKYFTNPAMIPPQPQQQQPDPNMLMIQMQKAVEDQKAQLQAQKQQSDAYLKQGDQTIRERELAIKEKEMAIKEFEAINKDRAESERISYEKYKTDLDAAKSDTSKVESATISAQAQIEKARIEAAAEVEKARIESCKSKSKTVEFIYDDDGEPIGAKVKEDGDMIQFQYNDDGEPIGATVE